MIRSMEELKRRAIKIEEGMSVVWPQFNRNYPINMRNFNYEKNRRRYSYNNGVVAFVTPGADVYVIPDIKGTQDVLKSEGYKKAFFYVPFSNWDFPSQQREEWEALWHEKNKSRTY